MAKSTSFHLLIALIITSYYFVQINSSSVPLITFQSSTRNSLSLLSEDKSCSKSPPSCDRSYRPPLDSRESCCYNGVIDNSGKQAGLVVATQFWDTNPPRGPSNSTGIHGLWLDFCDSTWPSYCNIGIPHYSGAQISSIIGRINPDLKSEMDLYFKDYRGHDENLWAHEQQKHMTCFPTLRAQCQAQEGSDGDSPTSNQERALVEYFRAIVDRFHASPTYEWLSAAGIIPSLTDTYSRKEIESVLSERHGGQVFLGCRGGQLNEFWYGYHLQGSVDGNYIPVDVPTQSSCPLEGIRWTPKV